MVALKNHHKTLLDMLDGGIRSRLRANRVAEDFYTGDYITRTLNIAVPHELSGKLQVSSDWPATVVDSYAERMHFLGWGDQGRFGMADVAELSGARLSVKQAVLDSMIFGVGFIAVEPDDSGVWAAQSVPPTEGTIVWDSLNRRPVAGLRKRQLIGGESQVIMYLPEGVLYLEPDGDGVEDFVPHGLGHPSIIRVRNNLRSTKWYGRSMISRPVRYYTVAACRTLEGMELNREFYTYPQRWLKNGTMDMFTGSDDPSEEEKVKAGFDAITGSLITLPPPEEGEPELELHQFSSSPPTPFIDQVRAYSQLMSSATGIPAAYLGFSTENPPSADAIRAWLDRLTLGCRNQQELLGDDLRRLGWMLTSLNRGPVVWREYAGLVKERWEDPASPTLSSDADAIIKLSPVIDPLSDWALDRLRIPDDQRKRMRDASAAKKLAELVERSRKAPAEDQAVADELASRRE